MSEPKAPPKRKAPPLKQPPALGDDEGFGENTFARGLKAVTEAIEEVAKHQGLHDEAPKKKKKK